jgi:hypothetical protein
MGANLANIADYQERLNRQTSEILIRIESILQRILESQLVQVEQSDQFLQQLVSSAIESSPNSVVGMVIPTTATPIASNDSLPIMTVNVANLDPAQPCWVGLEMVTTVNGRVIQPRDNVTIAIPLGKTLHAVCDVGFIQICVSKLYNLYSQLKQGG